VDQNVLLLLLTLLDEIYGSIEKALNVLGLRILEEISQVSQTLRFVPVLAVVTSTVYNRFYLVTF